jgi:multisubunit Na+/H+ antiporter MnhG subunit
MKRQHFPWYAAALAAVIVGAVALGVPASTLLLLLIVLACPVMMMFMMGGGHGHGSKDDSGDTNDHRDSAGRP